MADPLSITAGIIAVAGLALKSTQSLHSTIRGLKSQNKDARALKAEVGDLSAVLESLLETVAGHPDLDLKALVLPLERCAKACAEYESIITRCTRHSGDTTKASLRDWVKQRYLQGDINDFRAALTVYKSTINIALANANLRVAAIPPSVLESYKDLISDTEIDLHDHLKDLQGRIDRLKAGEAGAVDDIATEQHALLEEKQSTQRGLEICAQLASQITLFETTSTENVKYSDRLSAHKHIKSGLGETRGSIESLITRLRTHAALINEQLEAISSGGGLTEPVATQLARLQQTKDSIAQCIRIVSEANEQADERSNVFEDITLAENSYAFSVSTVNDLVIARRLNLTGRSRHFGGQVDNETVQQSVEALTQLDAQYIRAMEMNGHDTSREAGLPGSGQENQFQDRFGPGKPLSTRKRSN